MAIPTHAAPAIARYPNGLTVITEHREGAPVTAVQLWVRAGSVDEEERTVGLSHFLEHMLFKGTASRPVGSIHEEVEKNGGEINAATSDDWTNYHITIAADEWLRAAEIILDIASNASFPPEEVEREREVIREELARRDDNPIMALYDLIGTAAYREHPYRFRTIGDSLTLAATGRDELVAYYEKFYVPENMAFVIVGDFDSDVLGDLLDRTLAGLPAKTRPTPDWEIEKPSPHEPVTKTMPAALAYGAVTYPAPAGDDLRMNGAGDLLTEILSAGGIGRLRKTLVEDLQWADDISISFPTSRDPARFTVIYVAKPEKRGLIIEEIRREVRRLRVDGVTQKEVDDARDRVRLGRLVERESASSQASSYGFWYIVSRPEDEDRYDSVLAELGPADVEEFVFRYLENNLSIELAVLPEARREDAADKPEVVASAYAEEILVVPAKVPVAAIGIFIDGGQSVEPHPGWGALLTGAMNRGTSEKKYEAFTRGLALAGLTAGASIQEDMISLIGTAEPSRLSLLVDILFDMALSPNYADLNVVRDELAADIRARADRPFNIAYDRLNKERWGSHPYGNPSSGTVESLRAASPLELDEFRERLVARGAVRVILLGPIDDTPVLLAAIGSRLDGLGPAVLTPDTLPPLRDAEVVIPSTKSQAMLLRSVAAPAVGDTSFAVWKVANAILGGRSSSRLFRIVREERGLAYAVGSFYPSRKLGSQFVIYAGTRPQFVGEVRELFDTALYPATPDELEDARRLIKGEFALDHELAARRVWYLGWYASMGLGAEFDERYPLLIDAVDLAEVNKLLEDLRSMPVIEVLSGDVE